jgi:hypothetical protein
MACKAHGRSWMDGMNCNTMRRMHTLRTTVRRKGLTVWQILFCLTFLSFLCRAVVPAGYMPDASSLRGDKFAITFCIAGGGTTVLSLSAANEQGDSSSDEHAGKQECPYGLIVSQAALPGQDAPAPETTVSYRPVILPHGNQAQPRPSILGPPFGSRAPPFHLG